MVKKTHNQCIIMMSSELSVLEKIIDQGAQSKKTYWATNWIRGKLNLEFGEVGYWTHDRSNTDCCRPPTMHHTGKEKIYSSPRKYRATQRKYILLSTAAQNPTGQSGVDFGRTFVAKEWKVPLRRAQVRQSDSNWFRQSNQVDFDHKNYW